MVSQCIWLFVWVGHFSGVSGCGTCFFTRGPQCVAKILDAKKENETTYLGALR